MHRVRLRSVECGRVPLRKYMRFSEEMPAELEAVWYKEGAGMWRNWYTRTSQKRMSQDLGVRVSPCPPILSDVLRRFRKGVAWCVWTYNHT